jgi:nucleotide-binding universal stress UspA family protein
MGLPAEEIVHVAQKMQVDLIVMGNKGRRGIDRWVLGSVSEKVLQQAECPVLVVKLKEGDDV